MMPSKEAWILIEKDAAEKPELCQAAARLEISQGDAFLGWWCLWNWVDDHFPDGKLAGISFRALDQVSGIAGLAEQLSDVGWIRQIEGGLEVPDFAERWGRIAVSRYLARTKKREQRRSHHRSIDAAVVENLSIGVEDEGQKRDKSGTSVPKMSPECPENVPDSVAPRADLRSLDPLLLKTLRSIDSIRFDSIDRKEFDWEKVCVHAAKISKWVPCRGKPIKDRGLVLRACILAQTRLNEAWLWQALEAVEEHGPNNAAAYFRSCLVNGLAQFSGPLERNQLAQLYAGLESLVPISNEYLEQDFERRKARREQAG